MIKVKYQELKKIPETSAALRYYDGWNEQIGIRIVIRTIDEWMGFTTYFADAYEGEDGYADIIYIDRYVMSSNKETEVTYPESIKIMEKYFKEVLDTYNIKYHV